MKRIIVMLVTAGVLYAAWGFAHAAARGEHEAMPVGTYDSAVPRTAMTPSHPMHAHRPDGTHRHKVATIFVYVPVGAVMFPYYYAPSSPLYVDDDPPADAYRDLSGFYYWCPNPPGYYPYSQDCPVGWRLVAQ